MPRPRFLSKLGSWGSKVNKWRKRVAEERLPTPISFQNEVSPEEAPAGQRPDNEHQPSNSSRPPNGGYPSSSFSSPQITSPEPTVDVPAGDSQAVAVAANKTLKPTTATASHPSALDLTNGATSSCPQTPSAWSDLPSPPISSLDSNANTRPVEYGFWPTKPSLLGCIAEGEPVCGGAFSSVWRCRISFCTPSEALPTERFQQEGMTWFGLLDHPNIVPLIGWTLTPKLSFISPWYRRGNLAHYLKIKKISRTEQLQLLLDIAKGLEYLHSRSPPVVHGDLKPVSSFFLVQDNVLLSDEGEALLTDFGLSTIMGQESMYSPSHHRGGSVPWMSPEQMSEESKSCQSDVYSFGSLAFAVLTGKTPHHGLTSGQIICQVCHPINPRDPVKNWSNFPRLRGSVGDLLRDCWSRSPAARPPMSEVVRRLNTLLESCET
ncbi:hypothetical protein FRC04_011240 [Tulasnella sp. 424]|nr:hypothetical protein FRC04_011240 [Tulasnella sp. 424]